MKIKKSEHLLRLRDLYKPIIVPGERSFTELCAWLSGRYDTEAIPLSVFRDGYMTTMLNNAFWASSNDDEHILPENMHYLAFKLLETENNLRHLAIPTLKVSAPFKNGAECVYVAIEETTRYFVTNSNKLLFELSLASGISQYDYDRETDDFYFYIGYIHMFLNKEYQPKKVSKIRQTVCRTL